MRIAVSERQSGHLLLFQARVRVTVMGGRGLFLRQHALPLGCMPPSIQAPERIWSSFLCKALERILRTY
jgi:hypothetical protein